MPAMINPTRLTMPAMINPTNNDPMVLWLKKIHTYNEKIKTSRLSLTSLILLAFNLIYLWKTYHPEVTLSGIR